MFLDISNIVNTWNQSIQICKKWQNEIYDKVKLNVSFGISFNKFSAKMATNLEKPLGISLITKDNFQEKLWPLPIGKFYGIGKKLTIKLENINIKTIGDLATRKYNDNQLRNIFGKNLNNYIDLSNGISGQTSLQLNYVESQSISKSETFMEGPTNNLIKIKQKMLSFSKLIAIRLKNRNLVSLNVFINIGYGKNLKNRIKQTRQKKLISSVSSYKKIFEHAIDLLINEWDNREIIFIGVGVGQLISKYDVIIQQSIYDNYEHKSSKIQK